MEIYKDKQQAYYSNVRYDLVSLIPANTENKILEIGAGSGDTLVSIKEKKLAKEVVGIELSKLQGTNQTHPAIDRFIFGNIESMTPDLPQQHFDVILCGDVLEHLIDPWKTVEKLSVYLKPGGLFIASIPNIRHYKALQAIFFKGSFSYTEYGLFDKTHLRFFCKKDMVRIFPDSIYEIKSIQSILKFVPAPAIKIIDRLTFGLFNEFLSLQFITVARKR